MRKDVIYFVGDANMAKLFHRAMARNFNVHYPENEIRNAKSNIVSVRYSVISINDDFWNTSEMLQDIAEHVILTQEKHNAHCDNDIINFKIVEG